MHSSLFLIFVFIVFATAINMAFMALFDYSGSSARRLPLPQETGRQVPWAHIRAFISAFTPAVKPMMEKFKIYANTKNKLEAAHLTIPAEFYFSIKLFIMTAFAFVLFMALGKLEPIMLLLPAIFGYILPDLWLSGRIRARKRAIVQCLPEAVDLLGLCIEAGLDFTSALRWIADKTSNNPAVEELTNVAKEIKLGKTRIQALKDMHKRLNIPELTTFIQTLVQAERMGTPVAEIFNVISEDTRTMRFLACERMALQAPLKILIPLIFCILPVIAMIVGGPLFLEFMQGSGTLGKAF